MTFDIHLITSEDNVNVVDTGHSFDILSRQNVSLLNTGHLCDISSGQNVNLWTLAIHLILHLDKMSFDMTALEKIK